MLKLSVAEILRQLLRTTLNVALKSARAEIGISVPSRAARVQVLLVANLAK